MEAPVAVPTMAVEPLQRSLRRFITFDQVTCLSAVGVMLAVYAGLHRSRWLLLLAAMVAATAAVMGLGRRPLAAGDLGRAVAWVAVANWGIAIGATAIATFCLPITVIAAILPSVLAVPYVEGRALWRISTASLCVAVAVVSVGTLQDFSGLTDEIPSWLSSAVLLTFLPFVAGLVVMVGAHNSARLQRTLRETLAAYRRLQSSELELLESRTRLAAATDRERRRIARDLHDGAQQRLTSLAIGLGRARRLVRADPSAADDLLGRLASALQESIAELRDLTHGVYPAVLTDLGLAEALVEMAGRAEGRCQVEVGPLPRYPSEVEAAVYWCCMEALQNFTKHAGESAQLQVRLRRDQDGGLVLDVEDDGVGFDPTRVTSGQGLTNMADRLGAVGGRLRVSSTSGQGVHVHGTVPLPHVAPHWPKPSSLTTEP